MPVELEPPKVEETKPLNFEELTPVEDKEHFGNSKEDEVARLAHLITELKESKIETEKKPTQIS